MPARRAIPVPLRWSDMDAYGHVNNVQFLRILEEARVAAFGKPSGGQAASLLAGGLLVARAEIEYRTPLAWRPEPVEVALWVTSVAGASFGVGYEVADGATVYAVAETTMVVYDLEGGRPRRLTAGERQWLEDGSGDGVPFRRRRPVPA